MPRRKDVGRWVLDATGQFVWKSYQDRAAPVVPPPSRPRPIPQPPPSTTPHRVQGPTDVPPIVVDALRRALAFRVACRAREGRPLPSSDHINVVPLVWQDRPNGWLRVGVVYEIVEEEVIRLEVWFHPTHGGVRVERPNIVP